jgi:hypothetical protein
MPSPATVGFASFGGGSYGSSSSVWVAILRVIDLRCLGTGGRIVRNSFSGGAFSSLGD